MDTGVRTNHLKSIYVTDRRWPFMWHAYIRQLTRRIDTDFAPASWGGLAGVPTTEMVRMNLTKMMANSLICLMFRA